MEIWRFQAFSQEEKQSILADCTGVIDICREIVFAAKKHDL